MSLKFNHPDDDQQLPEEFLEQELPADFAALSEQLMADSQRLSSVYPAGRPPLELIAALGAESRRSLPRQILGLASAAAGILLLVGLVGFALSPMLISQAPGPDAVPAEPPPGLVHSPQSANESMELHPVSFRPAVVEVSGPALEGLLDLWQEQPQPDSTIAF